MTNYLPFLQELFGQGVGVITRSQFRTFMGISTAKDHRMYITGQYPRCIAKGRIALPDLADWLKQANETFNGQGYGEAREKSDAYHVRKSIVLKRRKRKLFKKNKRSL